MNKFWSDRRAKCKMKELVGRQNTPQTWAEKTQLSSDLVECFVWTTAGVNRLRIQKSAGAWYFCSSEIWKTGGENELTFRWKEIEQILYNTLSKIINLSRQAWAVLIATDFTFIPPPDSQYRILLILAARTTSSWPPSWPNYWAVSLSKRQFSKTLSWLMLIQLAGCQHGIF